MQDIFFCVYFITKKIRFENFKTNFLSMSFADNQNHTLTPPKRMYCRRYSPVLRDQILFIAEREGRMGDLEDFEGIKVLCKCQS